MLNKIPQRFWRYFWDVDPKKINPVKKSNFVIGRLLDKGDVEVVSWVLKNFPLQSIKMMLSSSRDISPKTAHFWRLYLKIPEEEIICLQEPYLKLRKSHWPF
ncbi:hypothetical protein B6D29_00305 [Microgenomates bacterium UTCPR1]|nr:hypothetical protein [Patescibacteria group bacterium]OQY68794.1 MAG: hypothetical protein B6D29_00305 [Microgenomates bacterium UTCPR1]